MVKDNPGTSVARELSSTATVTEADYVIIGYRKHLPRIFDDAHIVKLKAALFARYYYGKTPEFVSAFEPCESAAGILQGIGCMGLRRVCRVSDDETQPVETKWTVIGGQREAVASFDNVFHTTHHQGLVFGIDGQKMTVDVGKTLWLMVLEFLDIPFEYPRAQLLILENGKTILSFQC